MDGRRVGSVSLRVDAVYCAASAVLVLASTPLLAGVIGISPVVVVAVALVIAAWAAFMWIGSKKFDLRPMLWTVMSANVVAASGIGLLAFVVPDIAMTIVVVAVAVEVAAFAASQAVSLRTL